MKKVCGMRPTGRLHLGHLKAVVEPARDGQTDVLVAEYHAPGCDETVIAANVATMIRLGVPAGRIVRQKDVLDVALYMRLLAVADMGRLQRMTQYKDKVSKGDRASAHLLTYPVLMAADVARYEVVVVGEDQTQHIEYARDVLARIGLPAPVAEIVTVKVKDLRRPTQKMSKSNPAGCLFLDDNAATIHRKIMKAVTTPEGVANLQALYLEYVGGEPPASCKELKQVLAQSLVFLLGANTTGVAGY